MQADSRSRWLRVETARAAVVLGITVSVFVLTLAGRAQPGVGQAPASTLLASEFEQAVSLMETRGDYVAAAKLFEKVAGGSDRVLAARALVYLGSCYERLGQAKARTAYRRVLEHFQDQPAALVEARARLAALDRHSANTSAENLTLRRLWNTRPLPDVEIGRPSLDGRFLPVTNSAGQIALQHLRSGRLGPLLAIGRLEGTLHKCLPWSLPVLSVDATSVAFSCQPDGESFEVRIAPLGLRSRTERRVFLAAPGESVEPREWRLPGLILVQIIHADRSARIALLPVNGAPPRTIVSLASQAETASLSPDGRWLAYDARDTAEPPRHDVLVVSTTGGRPATVVGGPTDDLFPMWTPDGRGLLFVSDRTGSTGLWLQSMSNGRPSNGLRLLTADLGRIAEPLGVTTTGSFVYFRQTGLVDVQVVQLDADGQPLGQPSPSGTRYIGANMFPAWSPDGSRLAYRTELIGSRIHALGIRDLGTNTERIVAASMAWIDWPRWSPDGTQLLIRGRDTSDRYGFFIVDVENGRTSPVKLMSRNEEDSLGSAQWDRSGGAIIYVNNPPRFVRLDITTSREESLASLPTGTAVQVLPDPGFAISRDGSIAFVKRFQQSRTSLALLSRDGTVQDLLMNESGESFAGIAWMPDEQSLIFTRAKTDSSLPDEARWPSVWRFDLGTRTVRPLGLTMRRLRNIAISPDGRRLAFTAGAPSREPWVLEHFLPTRVVGAARGRAGAVSHQE